MDEYDDGMMESLSRKAYAELAEFDREMVVAPWKEALEMCGMASDIVTTVRMQVACGGVSVEEFIGRCDDGASLVDMAPLSEFTWRGIDVVEAAAWAYRISILLDEIAGVFREMMPITFLILVNMIARRRNYVKAVTDAWKK